MALSTPRPEVLSPAGSPEKLRAAVAYGADAVYLAGTSFGMRAGAGNFTPGQMAEGIALAHEAGVKVYVTCNIIPREGEMRLLPEFLAQTEALGADAFIVSDLGVLAACKKYAPRAAVHISTQAGVLNSETARAFYDLGASRVVLARETSLAEVAQLCARLPAGLEAEVFCHGAMCVSFSGRCVISDYLTGRGANHGECAQPCRWRYALMEEKRPGEYMPVAEDENGTYLYNSRDMCILDHVPELLQAGVRSLKIEGRTKSAYYTAAVTAAYRHAVDAALAGEPLAESWRQEVYKVSHRPYSTGFYYGAPGQYTADACYFSDYDVIALVEGSAGDGLTRLSQRNRFFPGEEAELLMPGRESVCFTLGALYAADGAPLESAPHPRMEVLTRLPAEPPAGSFVRRRRRESLSGHAAGRGE